MPFSALQTARLTGCSRDQLDYWARHDVVRPGPEGGYSFRDLVALRMVRSLLDEGVPLRRVRRAVTALVEQGDDLAGLRLVADGEGVWACRDDGQILDALRRGQLALFVAVDRIAADVETEVAGFDHDRQSFVAELRSAEAPTEAPTGAPAASG